jgi:hypothetical protein
VAAHRITHSNQAADVGGWATDSPTALKAAKCTTASKVCVVNSASIAASSPTSARTKAGSRPLIAWSRPNTAGELLLKSSTPTTSKPASHKASQVWEPI